MGNLSQKSGVDTRLSPIYTPLQVLSLVEGSGFLPMKRGYDSPYGLTPLKLKKNLVLIIICIEWQGIILRELSQTITQYILTAMQRLPPKL